MAVEFFSNGYDTTETNPYTEVPWADAHPSIGSASYGVRNPTDWKVTAVSGADRTVSIAAGKGFGHGVTDKTVVNETIQLDTVTSGSRWDLIACRRDWTPTGGVSQFVKVNGGATPVIPGGRLVGPGNIDDQPLYLVQVTAGQTQPTGFIDLRTWSGDGGGIVGREPLILSYLNATGTRININGTDWIRRVGANDVPEWFAPGEPTVYTPVTVANWSMTGSITTRPAGSKRLVTVVLTCKRTGADSAVIDNDNFISINNGVIPVGARGDEEVQYTLAGLINGGNNTPLHVALNPTSGVLSIRSMSPHVIKTNAQFSINLSYYI